MEGPSIRIMMTFSTSKYGSLTVLLPASLLDPKVFSVVPNVAPFSGFTHASLITLLTFLTAVVATEQMTTLVTATTTLDTWGHDFVHSLAREIGHEYNASVSDEAVDPRMDKIIVPFHMRPTPNPNTFDLSIEAQCLKKLLDLDTIDQSNYHLICLYLLPMADFM